MDVADNLVVYEKVIAKHIRAALPFMATENVMMAAALLLAALCAIVEWNRTPQKIYAAPVSSVYQAQADVRLDLNTADKEQLMQLPGIGEALAERILAFREANGGFVHVEQLDKVEGLSAGKISAIREYVMVAQ